MTPPRIDPHPTPDNVRPVRPPSLFEVSQKVDAIAREQTIEHRNAKDGRDLLGLLVIETRANASTCSRLDGRIEACETAIMREVGGTRRAAEQALAEGRQTRGIVARQGADIVAIKDAIGRPPADPADLARQSQHDLTPAAIEALEAGTGMRGDVARLEIHVSQLWRRGRWAVGLGAMAAAVSPHVPAIISALTGG